jgi:hypothetical protein
MIIVIGPDGAPMGTSLEQFLIQYVRSVEPIVGLDSWAHRFGVCPWWVRRCALSAASKGLINMTRMTDMQGQPYRVTAVKEERDEEI